MEPEERVKGDLGPHIPGLLGSLVLLLCLVETVDICLVVFGVVKLPPPTSPTLAVCLGIVNRLWRGGETVPA